MESKIYFGHPINTYDTELERELLRVTSAAFPKMHIENPNQKHHQEGYKFWKEKYGNGMNYFYKEVLPACGAGIFLPFRDGKWGAGIFGEALFLFKRKCLIYQITHRGLMEKLINLKSIPILSIEETRLRLRTESGERVPY